MPDRPLLTFNHTAIIVNDFEKSRAFYIEGLGAEEFMTWDALPEDPVVSLCSYLKIGNCRLELFGAKKPLDKPEGHELHNFIHICFESTDCQASLEQAVQAGGEMISATSDDIVMGTGNNVYKARFAFVKGPDGETIEFMEYR